VSHFDSCLGQEIYSLLSIVQSSVGAHQATYSKLNRITFPRGKDGQDLKLYIHLYLVSKFVYLFLYLAGVREKRNAYMVLVGSVSEETAR
jgi:uncharacterized MAPEG superfamily protein